MHRDISLDNIILYRTKPSDPRRGLLVDWEFSSAVDSSGQVDDDLCPVRTLLLFRGLPYRNFLQGTWAFMSGSALIGLGDFHYTIQDDLESLFYVIMYGSVRWLPHNHVSSLGLWMHDFFDETLSRGSGRTVGGQNKLLQIGFSGGNFLELFSFENCHVQDWFSVGYRLLGTTPYPSKASDAPCFWTLARLRELIAVVYDGLTMTDDSESDRFEHDVEGHSGLSRGSRDTQISLFAAARNFRIRHVGPELPRKRFTYTKEDSEAGSSEGLESERRRWKRRRLGLQEDDDIPLNRRTVDKRLNGMRRDEREISNGAFGNSVPWNNGMGTSGPLKRPSRTRAPASLGRRRSPRLQARSRSARLE